MKTIDDIGKEWSSYNPPSDDGILRIIQNWGNELISNFRSNLQKNKSLASRNLYQQIEPSISTQPKGYNLKIQMLDYWKYVENGRPPTRTNSPSNPTLQKSIEEWIVNKGIQVRTSKNQDRRTAIKSLAYVIARKIHRNGTKARPFISPALTDKTMQILSDRIGKYIAESLAGE